MSLRTVLTTLTAGSVLAAGLALAPATAAQAAPTDGATSSITTLDGARALSPVRRKIFDEALWWNGKTKAHFAVDYKSILRQPLSGSWCQDFVWYVWTKAGVKDAGSYNKSHAVRSFTYGMGGDRGYGADHGTVRNNPPMSAFQPGDAIVWDHGQGNRHVAVVIKNNGNGTLALMHGNYLDGLHYEPAATAKDAPTQLVSPVG